MSLSTTAYSAGGERASREGLLTFVFTDIEGYSRLSEQYRGAFYPLLERHNTLLRPLILHYRGREVKAIGDAFFLVFEHALDAVQFALTAQHALLAERWEVQIGEGAAVPINLRVRMGIHTGTATLIQHPDGSVDYIGADVNRASRVCSAGHGGQIVLSSATYAETAGADLPFQLRCLGTYWLKGVGREKLWQVWQDDLPADFPPLNAPRAELHNLVLTDSLLVGREREIAELSHLLLTPSVPLITTVGPSGVGKTRLAQAVAESVLEHFDDGVWYLSLEGIDTPSAIAQRILQALPLQAQADSPPMTQLTHYLQGRSILLILDDIESIEAVSSVVRSLLQVNTLKLMVISTAPLQLRAERLYEVKPLKVPPAHSSTEPAVLVQYSAVQMVVEHARRHRPDFELNDENAPPIADLCRHLDGLPLALELAGTRLALLSPREILKRLDERFQILQARNPDLPPRQRTLQSAIEWSYSQLSPETQDFFLQLGIFVDSFTLEDVEAICDSVFALDALAELRQHAMLSEEYFKGEGRFRLLNPMRLFALNRLREQPERYATVAKRHALYFLKMIETSLQQIRTAGEASALRECELYLRNFESAFEWFRSQGDWQNTARMALALTRLHDRLGNLHLIEPCLNRLMECVHALGDSPTELHADLLLGRSAYAYECHQWETAYALGLSALQTYEALGLPQGQAHAHNLCGLIATRQARYDQARQHFQSALERFEELQMPVWSALIRNNQGLIEYQLGNYEEAERLFTEAVDLQRALQDWRGLAESLTNLGAVRQMRGDLPGALHYCRESLRGEAEIGNRIGVARGLCNIGEVLMLMGDTRTSARYLVSAEVLFQQLGSPDLEYVHQLLHQLAIEPSALQSLKEEARRRTCEDLLYWAQNTQS